jgi:Uncharacterized protein conserved in bacteria (DUF2330)/HEAT repeats
MKTETRIWCGRCVSVPFVIIFLSGLLFAIVPGNLLADGCFVVPKFVWDKHKDINEPTQKAIIVHDAGREELILQVKYDGPVEEFGWLVPVPNLPTVKKGSMECFYELSKFTQKNLEPRGAYGTLSAGTHKGSEEQEPPVKVIEVKTVGAYDIAVLSTKDSGALENWLKENQFSFPANAAEVIDSYVKQQWYFIAVKINLKGSLLFSTSEKLASGELHPLQISFASERCIFPLKISSVNNKPTEVQVYVLSPEPLVERRLFETELSKHSQWRANMLIKRAESMDHLRALRASSPGLSGRMRTYPEPDYQLSSRSEINPEQLIPYALVGRKDIPVCSREIALLNKKGDRWLMKQTWTFQPEEMRDLEFEPAIPVFAAALADGEGALAAVNLMRLGTNGASALIAAMQNTNPAVRAHAMSMAEAMFVASSSSRSSDQNEEYPSHRALNPELMRLLPNLLNDPDPEVRLHAVYAAGNSSSPLFFNRMLKLLRDDYAEVSEAALANLRSQRGEVPKHIPLFRQMLKDTNVHVQIAGLRLLMSIPQVEIPRDELLALFSVPRMELAGVAVGYLKKESISCEEAKPLLHNSLGMVRMIGLAVLMMNKNSQSVELAIPLLRDPEEVVQTRAHDLLTDLTGQNFPAEQPEQWEKWWEQNKTTFTVSMSPEELRKKQLERARQRRKMENDSPP